MDLSPFRFAVPQTITACLVVHNEEQVIRRCLESIKDVVDEIVVVHDGECTDATLEICRRYTDKVFVRPAVGEAEPHRPFSFEQATGDWILWIDADEYLSPELRMHIRDLVQCPDVDLYCFLWPYTDGKRSLTVGIKHPYRACLGRRAQLYFYGLPHEAFGTYGRQMKVPLELVHRPNYNNYTWAKLRTKWLAWARLEAEFIWKEPSEIPWYGVKSPEDLIRLLERRRRRPLMSTPGRVLFHLGWQLYRGMWKIGVTGLKIAIMEALYLAAVNYYIFKYTQSRGSTASRRMGAASH